MFTFSKESLANLATCDERLQRIAHEAIKYFDFKVICGHRNEEDQNAAYKAGTSQLKFPNSKHNKEVSLAMDIVPYPIDWSGNTKNIERYIFMQAVVYTVAKQLEIDIRQGIDWNRNLDMRDEKFRDYPHVELI